MMILRSVLAYAWETPVNLNLMKVSESCSMLILLFIYKLNCMHTSQSEYHKMREKEVEKWRGKIREGLEWERMAGLDS